mmetsp:Transcript_15838/g.40367  ORF Transcript_15838/g.40367 Transcript_15838/m.40367 type:complete len:140 (+) Transcript_15838:189-608(+)
MGFDEAPVHLFFFHSRTDRNSALVTPALDDIAAVASGIVQVWSIDADAERDAAVQLGVRSLPTIQAVSASGRFEFDGPMSGEVFGRFALFALPPGSASLSSEAEFAAFHAQCFKQARSLKQARCGCAFLLPARDEPSPL